MKTAAYKKVPAARKKQISESLKKYHANRKQHAAIRQASLEFAQGLHRLEPTRPSPLEVLTQVMQETRAAKEKTIFIEAEEIIYGDREKTYGAPDRNLRTTADLWQTFLDHKNRNRSETLTPEDVCVMMILLKLSRQMNTHGRDSLVDICGYAGLIQRIFEKESSAARTEAEIEERRR